MAAGFERLAEGKRVLRAEAVLDAGDREQYVTL